MVLLDRFFDGTFFTYGIEVMSFADRDQEDRIDPVRNTTLCYVHPKSCNILMMVEITSFVFSWWHLCLCFRWYMCSRVWPSAHSTSSALRGTLRSMTLSASFPSTLSTRRYTFSSGSGSYSLVFSVSSYLSTDWQLSSRPTSEPSFYECGIEE